MQWLNEPSNWKIQDTTDTTIEVTSTQNTDFWRKTHYGFIRNTGHFYTKLNNKIVSMLN
jgi:uncharacterized protein